MYGTASALSHTLYLRRSTNGAAQSKSSGADVILSPDEA